MSCSITLVGGVMSWSSPVSNNRTLIFGNLFSNNTALAGGILYQSSYNITHADALLDWFWPDMMTSQDQGNTASYGPLIAGVINNLTPNPNQP